MGESLDVTGAQAAAEAAQPCRECGCLPGSPWYCGCGNQDCPCSEAADETGEPMTESAGAQSEIRNWTPHPLAIRTAAGGEVVVPPEPVPARIAERSTPGRAIETGDGVIPVIMTGYGQVTGLPAPQAGVVHVVSLLTLALAPERVSSRADLFAPGPEIRDADGRVVGCAGLRRIAPAEDRCPCPCPECGTGTGTRPCTAGCDCCASACDGR